MSFSGLIDSDQLAFLSKALDECCRIRGVVDDMGRNAAAARIILV